MKVNSLEMKQLTESHYGDIVNCSSCAVLHRLTAKLCAGPFGAIKEG